MIIMDEEIYIRYLQNYYDEHGTINDIDYNMVVEFEGNALNIGLFLLKSCLFHQSYDDAIIIFSAVSSKSLAIYNSLSKFDFDWEQHEMAILEEDCIPYIEYLKRYYEEQGSINDISVEKVFKLNGVILSIGRFLSRMKISYRTYKSENEEKNISPLILKICQDLEKLEFDNWDGIITLKDLALQNGVNITTLFKIKEKCNDNVEKALKIALLRKKYNDFQDISKHDGGSLKETLELFDLDIDTFIKYLDRDVLKTNSHTGLIVFDNDMTFSDFCLKNGYNEQIIIKAIRLKKKKLCDESFESLINRCIVGYSSNGRNNPASWIFQKYGNEKLVGQMLALMTFDPKAFWYNMTKYELTIEEAICYESFKCNKGTRFAYLDAIYYEMVDFYQGLISKNLSEEEIKNLLLSKRNNLISEYQLTKEEEKIISNSFDQYSTAIYQYHLFDVAFENDEEKRISKIINYNFSDADIEEAFFYPLNFGKCNLIGRNSNLYQRRIVMRKLIASLNDLSDAEYESMVPLLKLSDEEVSYVTTTRNKINRVQEKVYQYRRQ